MSEMLELLQNGHCFSERINVPSQHILLCKCIQHLCFENMILSLSLIFNWKSFYFRYCNRMQEENINRAIIVVQMGMTPSAKQVRKVLIIIIIIIMTIII